MKLSYNTLLVNKDRLKETIEYWINDKNKTDKIIEIIQFFY